MTKAELAARVADKVHLTKRQTETIVSILCTCITEALREGDKVELQRRVHSVACREMQRTR